MHRPTHPLPPLFHRIHLPSLARHFTSTHLTLAHRRIRPSSPRAHKQGRLAITWTAIGSKPAPPNHAGDPPIFQCRQCQKRFNDIDALTKHLNSPVHAVKYPCPECNQRFYTPKDLEKHRALHRRLECEACHRKFHSKEVLEKHLRDEKHGQRYMCGVCYLRFETMEELEEHAVAGHSEGEDGGTVREMRGGIV